MNENPEKLWSRSYILFCLTNLLMAISFYFLIPTLPVFMVEQLHADKGKVGLIIAVFTLSALLVRPFVGWALDNYSKKMILLSTFVAFAFTFFMYAFATTLGQLLVLRFLHGLSWGILTTSSSTMIIDYIPVRRRGEGLGYFGLGMPLAMALGPMVGLFIITNYSFNLMFVTTAVISLIGFVLISSAKFYPHPKHHVRKPLVFKGLFLKITLPISIVMLVAMFAYGGMMSFITLYAKELHIEKPGLFFLLLAIALGITRSFAGKIYDKHGPDTLMFMAFTLQFFGFGLLSSLKTEYGYLISAFLIGLGHGILFPTFQAMINNLVSAQQRGAANSTFFTALDCGIGIGSVAFGFLSHYFDLTFAFYCNSAIALISLVLYYILVKRHYFTNKLL